MFVDFHVQYDQQFAAYRRVHFTRASDRIVCWSYIGFLYFAVGLQCHVPIWNTQTEARDHRNHWGMQQRMWMKYDPWKLVPGNTTYRLTLCVDMFISRWQLLDILSVSEWVSSFLTAHKHNLGHLVPLQVKNQERKSNIITKWKQLPRIH